MIAGHYDHRTNQPPAGRAAPFFIHAGELRHLHHVHHGLGGRHWSTKGSGLEQGSTGESIIGGDATTSKAPTFWMWF
jgi:hypothetical protein